MSKKIESSLIAAVILGWFILSTQLIIPLILQLSWQGDIEGYVSYYKAHQYIMLLVGQLLGISVMFMIDFKCGALNLKAQFTLKKIVKYMMWAVGVWLLSSVMNAILLPYFPGYEAIDELFANDEVITRFFVIVIGAPLLEEYFFRGKIQGKLKEAFGIYYAVPIQAILFGSLHALALQKVYATVIGIIFGFVKEKEKSLFSTIVMHMTVNLIGFLIGTLAV